MLGHAVAPELLKEEALPKTKLNSETHSLVLALRAPACGTGGSLLAQRQAALASSNRSPLHPDSHARLLANWRPGLHRNLRLPATRSAEPLQSQHWQPYH